MNRQTERTKKRIQKTMIGMLVLTTALMAGTMINIEYYSAMILTYFVVKNMVR